MASLEQSQTYMATATGAGQSAGAQVKASAKPIVRDVALDIVKGACVIAMVMYHTINYFPDGPFGLKFVSFVTGAFILMAGFVATNIYLDKYDPRREWPKICRRLGVRALKLIAMAVVLNLLIVWLLPHANGKNRVDAVTTLHNLFLGTDYHSISFDLLLLIGYSLLLTTALFAIGRGNTALFLPFAVLCVVYATISNYFRWPADYYVRLITIGQLGAAFGLIKRTTIMNIGTHLKWVMVCFVAQLVAMAIWPPVFPLYMANVLLTVAAIYALGAKCNPNAWLVKKLILVGKYSLLAYLFQIGFLQVLKHFVNFTDTGVLLAFAVTTIATFICAEVTERLRRGPKWIDGAYRIVFA